MTEEAIKTDGTILCTEGLFPWWVLLLWGILTLIVGAMFLLTPGITTVLMITFMGAWWLIGGLFSIGSLIIDRTNMGWKLFLAAINILAGAVILLKPVFASVFILIFTEMFIGFLACFIGASFLAQAFRGKDAGSGILGIISLLFGLMLLVYPMLAGFLPILAGVFFLLAGISAIAASFMAKKAEAAA
ncbi:MAG TPA: DUF308 domain-containing protein [Methanoregulaceae archaeon]|nr:DUF308 domain-containing protein [Methanoregulaceae archaeon]HPD74814.1 DUF308 domain-containing protein [Methanoregulaceae archaeon]HRY75297.1 DUF308 domain-containing protein [Methanoregulaceae archaeon]